MIWNMTLGTWLYYFALPWSTFIFTVVYGIYWLVSPKYKKSASEAASQKKEADK